MTRLPLAAVLVTLLTVAIAPAAAATTPRPDDAPLNIIVIVSDDHRADVLGCAGHPIVRTPNLDRLAAGGVRFSEAFVTTSICAASRATILTGLVERTHRYTFGTPPLARTHCERSYPHLLRKAGYRTGFIGKLGVRMDGQRSTIDRMFDVFEPIRQPYRRPGPDGATLHITDTTGDRAIEFIRTNPAGTPFCLSVSFNAGHAQDGDKVNHYPPPPTEAELYADVPMPRPRLDGGEFYETQPPYLKDSLNRTRYFWRWDTPEKYDRNLRNYFRMISGLDRNVGRILDELESRGIADDTAVIFTGDNGYYMGERGFAGKWSHYDESLRVPLIVLDPRAPEASRDRVPEPIALNLDIAPTVLDLAGVEPPAAYQGRSLAPFVRAPDAPDDRDGFFCEHLMRHDRIPRWEGFRTRKHMYARYLDVDRDAEHLHDLEADPRQLTNLMSDRARRRQLLGPLRTATRGLADRYDAAGEPLPRVLMLGDSISMGYHRHVAETLLGEARVVRPNENCAGTTKGITKIDEWITLDGGGFDVIHFNFGLHDLKRVQPDSGRNSSDPSHPHQADPETYEQNLREIVGTLKSTGARLIFATTTPVPPGGVRPHRDVEDVARYNDAARRVMAEHGIPINDLYAFALARLDEIQQPVNVHFSPAGSRQLGDEVIRHLREAIAAGEDRGAAATPPLDVDVRIVDPWSDTLDATVPSGGEVAIEVTVACPDPTCTDVEIEALAAAPGAMLRPISTKPGGRPLHVIRSRDDREVVVTFHSTTDDLQVYEIVQNHFVSRFQVDLPIRAEALDIDDADNDGHTDIVIGLDGGSTPGQVRIYRHDPDTDTLVEEFVSGPLPQHVEDLEIGDADNDGLNEIVVGLERISPDEPAIVSRVLMFEHDASGWSGPIEIAPPEHLSASDVDIGDPDNDGVNEVTVLFANLPLDPPRRQVRVYEHVDGAWVPEAVTPPETSEFVRAERMVIADVDDDGSVEIVTAYWQNLAGRLVTLSRREGLWVETLLDETVGIIDAIDVGDFDGDEHPDLIVGAGALADAHLRQFEHVDGAWRTAPVSGSYPLDIIWDVEIGDFNHDGVAEALGAVQDTVHVFTADDTDPLTSVLYPVDLDSIQIGDVDGDERSNPVRCDLPLATGACRATFRLGVAADPGTAWDVAFVVRGRVADRHGAAPRDVRVVSDPIRLEVIRD